MSNLRWTTVGNEKGDSITVVVDGLRPLQADDQHPNFARIVELAKAGDESVVDLFDYSKTVTERFQVLSERVTVKNGQVLFDGDVQDGVITDHIIRFVDEGVEDWKPLVAFMDNIAGNPQEHSRAQLYRWLSANKFTITADGLIVGYKGVNEDYSSVHNGPGIVDGIEVTRVVSKPGSVVEMARSAVAFDPSQGCAYGLHVGTYDYAKGFARKQVEVHVNPRDVVSVPTDSGDAKMRVCRYKVIRDSDGKHGAPLLEVTDTTKAETWADKVAEVPAAPDYDEYEPNSSLIDFVEWDGSQVRVELRNGGSYRYNAPYSVFTELKNATSAGKFYNENLRGKFNESYGW